MKQFLISTATLAATLLLTFACSTQPAAKKTPSVTLAPFPEEKMRSPKRLNLAVLKRLTTEKPPSYNDPLVARAFSPGEVYVIPKSCALEVHSPMLQMRAGDGTSINTFRLTCLSGILPFMKTFAGAGPARIERHGSVVSESRFLSKAMSQEKTTGLIEIGSGPGAIDSVDVYFRFVKLD